MIDEVLDAVVARLETLALALAGGPVPVRRGKHPVQEDGSGEAQTQLTVAAQQVARQVRRFSNRADLHTYRVRAAAWTPGNRDNAANLPDLADWEEAIGEAFRAKPAGLLGLDGLRDVRSAPASFLDRGGFQAGWDVVAVDIEIDIVRERAGVIP